ncbi:unnamed protein product [Clavelina lepadiformis]|uniref:Uncharacterized protein n=1 Tax=Clavelina lepadiformis TaxID=159417 RepID=A0ABP0GZ14_CLALP
MASQQMMKTLRLYWCSRIGHSGRSLIRSTQTRTQKKQRFPFLQPKQPSYTSKAAKNKEEMANNVKSAFQSSDGWCSTELCPGYVPDSSLAFPSVKAGTL